MPRERSKGTRPQGRPTIRTIAEAAGVSTATVSYVLNNRDLSDNKITISQSTRDKVLGIAGELGYSPNQSARGMSLGRTDQVCVALDYLGSPRTQAIVDAVTEVCDDLKKTGLLLLNDDWFTFLSRQGADVAVMHGVAEGSEDHERIKQLAARGSCMILLGSSLEPDGFDVIRPQPQAALDEAMQLLLSRHTRIACLIGVSKTDPAYVSYRAALKKAGITLDARLVRTIGSSRERAYWDALDLLKSSNRPTAFITGSDLSALSVLRAAHRLGLDVPGDLEIIGLGNSPEGQAADPPLTSAGADSTAGLLADLLRRRLNGDMEGQSVHNEVWSLHQRGTTR